MVRKEGEVQEGTKGGGKPTCGGCSLSCMSSYTLDSVRAISMAPTGRLGQESHERESWKNITNQGDWPYPEIGPSEGHPRKEELNGRKEHEGAGKGLSI